MASQRRVPRNRRCCCPGGNESQRSPYLFNTFCSSALSEFQAVGADDSAAGTCSARTRPATASCRPTAHKAASAARRPGTKRLGSFLVILIILRRRLLRRSFRRRLAREMVEVCGGEEIAEAVLRRVFVHLIDPAQELEHVFVRLRLPGIAHDSMSPAAHS